MYSIRRRLVLVLVAGFAIVIAISGIFLDRALTRRVMDDFDSTLVSRARALTALIEGETGGKIEFDYPDGLMPEFERAVHADHFQIFLKGGRSIARSAQLKGDLERMDLGNAVMSVRDVTMPDDRPGRILQMTFVPGSDPEDEEEIAPADAGPKPPAVTLVVARGREPADTTIAQLRWTMLGFGALAVALATLFAWRALARGLRPLDAIVDQVQHLDADKLDARIALDPRPRELAPVVDQLNALLERLRGSFDRERRFNANVAHELRTPIAELRSLAEVGGKWPEDTDSVVAFFGDVNDVATRMEATIADLLLLARCQAGVERTTSTTTDLNEILSQTWTRLSDVKGSQAERFENATPAPLLVQSDPGKLAIVFQNLLGNALSYATPATPIVCEAKQNGSGLRIEIANHAPPLERSELSHLADPFWRKDEARSASTHVGLGLSVVSAVADLLGLRLDFDQDEEGRFKVGLEGWSSLKPRSLHSESV